MRSFFTLLLLISTSLTFAQTASISGKLLDTEGSALPYANVALYNATDSAMVEVEASDEAGKFLLQSLTAGSYFVKASFVGVGEVTSDVVALADGETKDLGTLSMSADAIQLEAASVVTERPLVEVQPDRTVFNVEGTINSIGDNAMSLMRKAPGVTVDNNDNINVLGRAGAMVFVDGKMLPLSGQDLADYLKNLPSDQIDRIDIITNPGAKYDAEGNAGIIDIRLKKDKNLGTNGSARVTATKGQLFRNNGSVSANHRNKKVNIFGQLGGNDGSSFNDMHFLNYQNGLFLDETNRMNRSFQGYNYRGGVDYFINNKHTIGILASGNAMKSTSDDLNQIYISQEGASVADSVLRANAVSNNERVNGAYNLNYRFDDREKQRSINVDLDYGQYDFESVRNLPNQYWDSDLQTLLVEIINEFDTPSYIDIYTGKIDYEDQLAGGKIGVGAKYSQVVSDNTFLVYDVIDDQNVRDDSLSNTFVYDESVYAGYVQYSRKLGEKLSGNFGVRAEQTEARGDLQTFVVELQEPPVIQSYLRWFPSAGLTYQLNHMNTLSLNYGRRINRPDYQVLNPFNNQLSQISFEKGNPRLQPEIVNNAEIGWTYQYRFNFKLGYSKTVDQITRLIAPDDVDTRASFITWDNLASQTTISFNASLPFQITEKWSAYFNVSGAYLDNQADYGNGAVVDVQAYNYNIFSQNTIQLPWGLKGEVSGWYSGPGVWGGVFLYDPSWSLNFGLQKQFLNDALNVRVAANDVFYETGWSGYSDFNGLYGEGNGNWDSRWVSLSIGYNFGNQNVKSRKRQTGIEEEAGRVGGD